MRSRWSRIALLVFQAVWLNIIVPGHTRGIVQMPGACCTADACCAAPAACANGADANRPGGESRHAPRPGNPGNCAICNFAARLTLPPVIDYIPPLTGVAIAPEAPAPIVAPTVRIPLILQDRAPPLAA